MENEVDKRRRKYARMFLWKYNFTNFSWDFKQIFFLWLGILIVYEAIMMIMTYGYKTYYLYIVLGIWLVILKYAFKWIMALIFWWILKNALRKSGIKMVLPISKVEYVETWSQKWSFISAVPVDWVLEGMNVTFKSEKLNFKIPPELIRRGDTITVYVDNKNLNNYWMDIKGMLKNLLK